jgi:regulator of replication initiation timing
MVVPEKIGKQWEDVLSTHQEIRFVTNENTPKELDNGKIQERMETPEAKENV